MPTATRDPAADLRFLLSPARLRALRAIAAGYATRRDVAIVTGVATVRAVTTVAELIDAGFVVAEPGPRRGANWPSADRLSVDRGRLRDAAEGLLALILGPDGEPSPETD